MIWIQQAADENQAMADGPFEKTRSTADSSSSAHSKVRHTTSISRSHRLLLFFTLVSVVIWLTFKHGSDSITSASTRMSEEPKHTDLVTPSELNSSRKIPLEAHIMSKCPDARDCLEKLIVPTMEKVSSRVAFNLSFIGT